MESILKTIGIDVHKDTYSICTFNSETKDFEHEMFLNADPKMVLKYLSKIKAESSRELRSLSLLVGYEAGPTGFELKRCIENNGFDCKLMASTTIFKEVGGKKLRQIDLMHEI